MAEELLRRHERRGAPLQTGGGDPCAALGEERQAEVDDAGAVRAEQHVRGLEVAVDDPLGVDVLERGGDADGRLLQGVGAQGAVPLHLLGQGRAGDVLDDEVRRVGVRVGVQQSGRAAAPEASQHGDLAPEARGDGAVLVAHQFGADRLDGDTAALAVLRQIDGAHAPGADASQDSVAADHHGVVGMQRAHGPA
nr:hypothetical protein [Actinomadura sp. WAC 06369]